MFTFTRNWFLGFAAAGALALTVASVPAFADELSLNLGAVGPNEPILKTVGSKRVIASLRDRWQSLQYDHRGVGSYRL